MVSLESLSLAFVTVLLCSANHVTVLPMISVWVTSASSLPCNCLLSVQFSFLSASLLTRRSHLYSICTRSCTVDWSFSAVSGRDLSLACQSRPYWVWLLAAWSTAPSCPISSIHVRTLTNTLTTQPPPLVDLCIQTPQSVELLES